MGINLLDSEKRDLESRHKKERDKRVADRMKAVLLKSEKWTDKNIAIAFCAHEDTVRTHLDDWRSTRFCLKFRHRAALFTCRQSEFKSNRTIMESDE